MLGCFKLSSSSRRVWLKFTISMSFRLSMRTDLSLISADAIHVLIWSRSRCSFLISFFRSSSYFSFWFELEALWTFCQISSNFSTPSATFFRHRSISAEMGQKRNSFRIFATKLIRFFVLFLNVKMWAFPPASLWISFFFFLGTLLDYN